MPIDKREFNRIKKAYKNEIGRQIDPKTNVPVKVSDLQFLLRALTDAYRILRIERPHDGY